MQLAVSGPGSSAIVRWLGPRRVEVESPDPRERRFIERVITDDARLGGPVDCPRMLDEDARATPEDFRRACHQLERFGYHVAEVSGDARNHTRPPPPGSDRA